MLSQLIGLNNKLFLKKGEKMAKPITNFIDTEIIPYKEIKGAPGQYEKILTKDPQTGAYTRLILSQPDLDEIKENFSNQ